MRTSERVSVTADILRDVPRPPRWRRRWTIFRQNRTVVGAALVILMFMGLAISAPVLPLRDPNTIDMAHRLTGPFILSSAILGTDEIGRDMLSRLRISLLMGFTSAVAALVVGARLGIVAGFWGRGADQLIMRSMDILMAFPFILLAIALVAALGPGLFNAMVAIAVVGMPQYARVVRASTLVVREHEYVLGARAIGASSGRLLVRHIAPNIVGPILVLLTLDIGTKIIATASLSFLGLGAQPPTADCGYMLATGRQYIATAWWAATLPGLAIFIVVLAFNLLGDGLRDALDPRSLVRDLS